ncbi:MAG: HIT family protein [Phycisphaerales bacterium]|nr:HIT family protein [Phycisphaerales bacterium]
MSDLTHLFEKIVAREIPSHTVYEDDLIYAFLDVNPLSVGHTLVIPKKRYESLADVPEDAAAALGRALPKITAAVVQVTGADAYNVLLNCGKRAGQVVPHVHFHIIPKYEDGSGLGIGWKPGDLADGPALAQRIADAIH